MARKHYWKKDADISGVTEKPCSNCGEVKDLSLFGQDKRKTLGRMSMCKSCVKIRYPRSRYRGRYKKATQYSGILRTYGVTREQYDQLYSSQEGKCAICGNFAEPLTRDMSVDHCHDTGKVRGLLCRKCNLGIGHLNDDPWLVIEGAKYLMRHDSEYIPHG